MNLFVNFERNVFSFPLSINMVTKRTSECVKAADLLVYLNVDRVAGA